MRQTLPGITARLNLAEDVESAVREKNNLIVTGSGLKVKLYAHCTCAQIVSRSIFFHLLGQFTLGRSSHYENLYLV